MIVRIFRALKRYENRRSRRAKSQHQVNERMMARWTRHVGLFTGALVAVGIVTAVIFLRQLNVMQGQLDEMKVEQRPWVYADSPRLTDVIRINEVGLWTLHLKFGVYNVGHLPGQYTHTPVVSAIADAG